MDMYSLSEMILCIVLLLVVDKTASLRCYKCPAVDQLSDCKVKGQCASDEHCHVRKYFSGGKEVYGLDCTSLARCSHQEERRAMEIDLWTACCHEDDCNKNFDSDGQYLSNLLQCYKCPAVDKISDCKTTAHCGANEHCHARQYYTGGKEMFGLDCVSVARCIHQEVSRDLEVGLWTACCKDDLCNMNFDSSGKYTGNNLECYSCKGISDPADCTEKQICNQGEACLVHEKITELGKSVYDMSCIPQPVCAGMGFGLTKRRGLCKACCNDASLCNSKFCSVTHGSVTPVTPKPTVDEFATYHLVVKPAAATVNLGDTVTFECYFDPPVQREMKITWFHVSDLGSTEEVFSEMADPPRLNYVINGVVASDWGLYICESVFLNHTWTAIGTLHRK